ncbi:MAG: radical SAM protein [Bacteroidales bacterium]|nr:radical SAM protein [Bacteroidales bacterium]
MKTQKAKNLQLRLAHWQADSLVDGPGLRFTVFAQGCPHRCPGCHNPETHLPLGGSLISVMDLFKIYSQAKLQDGITLSGGEPFVQAEAMAALAHLVHQKGDSVVCYSGYTYEQLQKKAEVNPTVKSLLGEVDLLIDGPFLLKERSLILPYRGSKNQRIIPLSPLGYHLIKES